MYMYIYILSSATEVRKFTKKGRGLEELPPTRDIILYVSFLLYRKI